jgi:hypothetical protein
LLLSGEFWMLSSAERFLYGSVLLLMLAVGAYIGGG